MFLNAINHTTNRISQWIEVCYKCSNGHLFYVSSTESHYNLYHVDYTTNSIEYKQWQEISRLKNNLNKFGFVVIAQVVTNKWKKVNNNNNTLFYTVLSIYILQMGCNSSNNQEFDNVSIPDLIQAPMPIVIPTQSINKINNIPNYSSIQKTHIYCSECRKNGLDPIKKPVRISYKIDNDGKSLWMYYKCTNDHIFAVCTQISLLLDSYEYCKRNNIVSGLEYGIIIH